MNIPIFDCHIHSDSRSAEDYELMAISGVEAILVPCTFTGLKKDSIDAYRYCFDRVIGLERSRAQKFGIQLYAALSVHPGDIVDYQVAFDALEVLKDYLNHDGVKAIGEITPKSCSEKAKELFTRHMVLAKEHNLPVIIESSFGKSGTNIDRTVEAIQESIQNSGLPREKILLVDLNRTQLELFWPLNMGGYGIAVSPTLNGLFVIHEKNSPEEALQIIEQFGQERIMFNSALHFGFGDPLCLSRTLLHLSVRGVPESKLTQIAYGNAMRFFGIDHQ